MKQLCLESTDFLFTPLIKYLAFFHIAQNMYVWHAGKDSQALK